MKKCRRCEEDKELSEYYKHSGMFDGYLNYCKVCTKERVKKHRDLNIDKIQEYDRNRPNARERNEKNKERIKNLPKNKKEEYRKAKKKIMLSPEYKNKKYTNQMVNNAIRDKKIIKKDECEHCGADEKLDGHHPSYLRPLEVIWLCKSCHGKEHKRLREKERKQKNQ